jgi:transposase
VRFVAVYSTQLAEQQAHAYSKAHSREAEALAQHIAQVAGRPFACAADAEAAIAEYEGRQAGKRGRHPCRWHYHTVSSRVAAQWQRTKWTRRGRPPKDAAPQEERVYHLVVQAQASTPPVATFGWTVLATTVGEQQCGAAEIVRAYREQTPTVEPGFRWIKNPAAISPVWLEKPERMAAWAMRTVGGLLVYGLIQRQVRQSLQPHGQCIPGNKGETAMPTATVVLASFAQVTLVHLEVEGTEIRQVHGWQELHQLICKALGVDDSWFEVSTQQKNNPPRLEPP